jgi:hypothetical protein
MQFGAPLPQRPSAEILREQKLKAIHFQRNVGEVILLYLNAQVT